MHGVLIVEHPNLLRMGKCFGCLHTQKCAEIRPVVTEARTEGTNNELLRGCCCHGAQ